MTPMDIAKWTRTSPQRPPPYTKKYRRLRKAGSGRAGLPREEHTNWSVLKDQFIKHAHEKYYMVGQ